MPTNPDAASAVGRGVVERHLGPNATDELFAKAMVKICDGWPPECSLHHTCMHGGDCFRGRQDIAAAKIIESVAADHDGGVKAFLLQAAHAIRAGSISVGAVPVPLRPQPKDQ